MKKEATKKAATEMWWIIIGAVIALVVLIILLVLFTTKTGGLEKGLTGCAGKGAICVSTFGFCPVNTLESSAFECSAAEKCCVGLPKKQPCDESKETSGVGGYCYPTS